MADKKLVERFVEINGIAQRVEDWDRGLESVLDSGCLVNDRKSYPYLTGEIMVDIQEPEYTGRDTKFIAFLHFLQAHCHAQILLDGEDQPLAGYLKKLTDPIVDAYKGHNRGLAGDITRQVVDEVLWQPAVDMGSIIQRSLIPMCYLAMRCISGDVELLDLYQAPLFSAHPCGFWIRTAMWLLIKKPETLKDCKWIWLEKLHIEERELVLEYIELRDPSFQERMRQESMRQERMRQERRMRKG